MYINLATGVGMEEKREVAYAHKKVLQGPLKEDADELFYNSICNGLSTDIYFHGFDKYQQTTIIWWKTQQGDLQGVAGWKWADPLGILHICEG